MERTYDKQVRNLPMRSGRICQNMGCQNEAKLWVTFRKPSRIAKEWLPALQEARRVCEPCGKAAVAQEASVCA